MSFPSGISNFAFADVAFQPVLRQLPDRIPQGAIDFRNCLQQQGTRMWGLSARVRQKRLAYNYRLCSPSSGTHWGQWAFSALPTNGTRPVGEHHELSDLLNRNVFMLSFQYFYLNPMTPAKTPSSSIMLHPLLP